MDEKRYGSDQPGYDTDTFGTTGQTYHGRKEGTYKQDTSWTNVPPQGNPDRNGSWQSRSQGGNYQQAAWKNGTGAPYGTPYRQNVQPGYGFGIASMVLGILALVMFWNFLNIPLAVLAIIFAVVHFSRGVGRNGFAVAGIVTSVVSVVLTILMVVLIVVFAFGARSWSYSQTIPFEQFIDGNGEEEPDYNEWDDDSDEFMNYPGESQVF